jgi:hypothetical protein
MSEAATVARLISESQGLIQQGMSGQAIQRLREAQSKIGSPEIPMNIALALRMQGDLPGAMAALDEALAIDPYHFLALLSKGSILERLGQWKQASRIYINALKIAPPDERLPPQIRGAVETARRAVSLYRAALANHLKTATMGRRALEPADQMARFDESLNILAGQTKAYVQEPTLLNFPRLPAVPFFDRSLFPWLEQLEAATDVIRAEVEALLARDAAGFSPYIQYPAGAPVNQWAQLNHSTDWSSLHLWRDGRQDLAVCEHCPRTTEILMSLPMADQPGFAPTAMYSMLAPNTAIPPHTGATNVRSIVHLPLILPRDCGFRVGNETREWRMGEAWVFDDTIEHEAWNRSGEVRVILIFDVWNPYLTLPERALVTDMMGALNGFNAD